MISFVLLFKCLAPRFHYELFLFSYYFFFNTFNEIFTKVFAAGRNVFFFIFGDDILEVFPFFFPLVLLIVIYFPFLLYFVVNGYLPNHIDHWQIEEGNILFGKVVRNLVKVWIEFADLLANLIIDWTQILVVYCIGAVDLALDNFKHFVE
jgi:hypothetical protein